MKTIKLTIEKIAVIFLILLSTTAFGQQHKYDRAGVTIIYTTHSDNFDKAVGQYYQNFTPDARYDVNKISTISIPASWPRMNYKTNDEGKKIYNITTHTEDITEYIKAKNVARDIISSIFNRKADGSMDLMTVHYRGQYNATDQEYLTSISSKRGAESIKETGEMLIDKSYIAVFDLQNIRYEKIDSDTDYNYRGQVVGYIYKIEWSETLLYSIWDCWIDENTPESEKAAKIEAFNKLDIPITFVTTKYTSTTSIDTKVEAAKKNPILYGNKSENQLKEEAITKLFSTNTKNCFQLFESTDENLALKTSIYSTKPIRAKLGTKEGLKKDYNFYVYENRQDDKGNIKAKRIGVIRATNKIADNKRITTGNFEPSEFYQFAGKKVEPGQDITETKKINSSIELGGTFINTGAFYIAYEYDGYATRHTQYFLGMAATLGGGGYNAGINVGYGFRMNNFQLYPVVGIYYDGLSVTTQDNEKESPSAFFAQVALKANINIYYPVQLFLKGGYNATISENESYTLYKGDRNVYGITMSAGIRYCF
jgi:hypothetical protein